MQNLTIDKESLIYDVHKQVSDLMGEKIALSFEPIVSGDAIVLVCSISGSESRNKGFSFSFLTEDIDNRALKLSAYADALDVFGVNLVIQRAKPPALTQSCPQSRPQSFPGQLSEPPEPGPDRAKKKGMIGSLDIPDKLKSKLKQAVKEFQLDKEGLKELILSYGDESNYKFRTLQDIADEDNIDSFIDFIYEQYEPPDGEE